MFVLKRNEICGFSAVLVSSGASDEEAIIKTLEYNIQGG